MRKWFNMAVLLVSGIFLAGCASNITSTVTVGFRHGELINEIDGTGDNNGWDLGGSLGFKFSDRGLAAIRTCGGGTVIFSNQSFVGDDLKTISNRIPAEICSEFELTKDDEEVNDGR